MSSVHPWRKSGWLSAAAFLLVVGGVALFLYLPTLTASYAYDDLDYLNLSADVLSGHRGYWGLIFRPHLEHLVPMVRIAFHASAAFFGYDAFPFRLLVFLVHLGSAFFISMIVRRHTSDTVSPLAAGLAYVVPVGFSSMWVWLMTGAGVPFGLLGVTGALTALVYRDRVGSIRAQWLAGAGILLTLLSENTLAPTALGPILLDWDQRRRQGKVRPGPLAVFGMAAIGGCLALSSYLYKALTGAAPSVNLRASLPRSVWLLLVAPFRYFCPGLPLSPAQAPARTAVLFGALYGLFFAAAVAAIAVSVSMARARELMRIAGIAAIGPAAVVALVGLGRWKNSFQELYDADRYFFTLLVPIALFLGALCSRVRSFVSGWARPRARAFAALAVVALGVEIFGHRRALELRFPRQVFDAHERRFRELSTLAGVLADAARLLPAGDKLEFPDNDFWFPDVHNGRLSARFLFTIASRGIPGVHLDSERVGDRDERLINPALESWARQIGEALPYFSVANGRLMNAREVEVADFRKGAHDEVIVSGLYGWEEAYRWMGPRGELRLVMNDPVLVLSLGTLVGELRKKDAAFSSMHVRVTLVAEESGAETSPGTVEIAEDGIHSYKLDAQPLLSRLGQGRVVHVVLQASPGWRPIDVLPRSQDPRLLTVQVFLVGFQGS